MRRDYMQSTDRTIQQAEEKAALYFKNLRKQVEQKTYIPHLTIDIQHWKKKHILKPSFLSIIPHKKNQSLDFHHYIQSLDYSGKLTEYLDRSISYIFMRDLGKSFGEPETKVRIQRVINSLKQSLTKSPLATQSMFSIAGLYRIAQKEGIETTLIWLINKLKVVAENIPKEMNVEHGQRKLIKIIAGVLMHELESMGENLTPREKALRLDRAIRLGYSYGLTYPFIDDLLDANILSEQEKKQYSDLISTSLLTGSVPELGKWPEKNINLISFAHSELRDAFEYIKTSQGPGAENIFFEQTYLFFYSQEVDRVKDLSKDDYTNEEIYISIILKSSSSRLIVPTILNTPVGEEYHNRLFHYGIYNQLADDFADMFDDMEEGRVTPYTYYVKYHNRRPDLLNPFELYWAVISNLIHNVYRSEPKAREIIFARAINGLKRFKEKMGVQKYNEIMNLFANGNPKFNRIIQKLVKKADDIDFLDKLFRDHIFNVLKNEKKEREDFLETIKKARDQINHILTIHEDDNQSLLKGPIIHAANYSLEGDGKRLRPILTWVMGIKKFNLNHTAIVPLLRSLEYMHTASLIFDDLPSQDNASLRRGRPTLHQSYNVAIAELTGIYLIQKAVNEQASLDEFEPKTVLRLIQYSSKVTEDMCKGQAMDLDSKEKRLTLDELNTMCFYKTGIAFEASLVMPALLANAEKSEIEALKKFAYHAGIAFQIKDDLLDVEGDINLLGKPIKKDIENNNSTFVSVLGSEDARRAMWEHYCFAFETLLKIPGDTTFLKQVLHYFVNRNH